jgi:hypothetical protein
MRDAAELTEPVPVGASAVNIGAPEASRSYDVSRAISVAPTS